MDDRRAAAGPPHGMSMVVSNLDGTLLDARGRISPRTVAAVAELRHAGIHFVIATARPLRDILEIARTLALEGPIICQNGAVIAFRPQTGSDVKQWLMDTALQRGLVMTARAEFPGYSIAIDYPHCRLADPHWPGPFGRTTVQYPLWPLSGPELPRRQAVCVMIRDAWDDPSDVEERFHVSATTSAPGLLEISGRGIDKAGAMLRICKMFEISPDDVIAFRDMPNDLSLLTSSGLGIAVSNAPPSVQATADGEPVPSVLGAKSKASNFGREHRPWIELRAHQFSVHLTGPQALTSAALPTNLTYLFGLLAWTLDGRDDLATLAYYRRSAADYSDDGMTLCGAFGARLFDRPGEKGQVSAIRERLTADPASRRAYATVILPADNLVETREYPCAAGVQLFLRDGRLHWLTIMRAQQALTILPYDTFLFSCLHQFAASFLGCELGDYTHFSGTFHIYENELALAAEVVGPGAVTVDFPAIPAGHGDSVARELIDLERSIRTAAVARDGGALLDIEDQEMQWEFNDCARRYLLDFARARTTVQATR